MTLDDFLKRDSEKIRALRKHIATLRNDEILEFICIASVGGYGDNQPAEITAYFEGVPHSITLQVGWNEYRDYLVAEAYRRMQKKG